MVLSGETGFLDFQTLNTTKSSCEHRTPYGHGKGLLISKKNCTQMPLVCPMAHIPTGSATRLGIAGVFLSTLKPEYYKPSSFIVTREGSNKEKKGERYQSVASRRKQDRVYSELALRLVDRKLTLWGCMNGSLMSN